MSHEDPEPWAEFGGVLLNNRAANQLEFASIRTVEDLAACCREDFHERKGCGKKSCDLILAARDQLRQGLTSGMLLAALEKRVAKLVVQVRQFEAKEQYIRALESELRATQAVARKYIDANGDEVVQNRGRIELAQAHRGIPPTQRMD